MFFESTLDINSKVISTALEKYESGILKQDQRGKHGKHYRVTQKERETVKDHINSIPRIESHYLRAQTTREFIDGGLTIRELCRMYCKQQEEKNESFVNTAVETSIFLFFIPKKDQCDLCVCYSNAQTKEEKAKYQAKFTKHHEEKKMSRIEKQRDKDKAGSNFIVACYDLQAVLPVLRGDCSPFFYKSRLATYNLTVSKISSRGTNVNFYLWDETQGNREANEIGTCIMNFLEKKQFKPWRALTSCSTLTTAVANRKISTL